MIRALPVEYMMEYEGLACRAAAIEHSDRHFENWLSINMVVKRGSQGPSPHNGASKAAAIRTAQTAIITDDKYLTGSSTA